VIAEDSDDYDPEVAQPIHGTERPRFNADPIQGENTQTSESNNIDIAAQ
jgi:hypothetical protein